MAGGCYTLVDGGEPLLFQATDLGHYLLYDAERRFVSAGGGRAAEPGDDTVWRADPHGGDRDDASPTPATPAPGRRPRTRVPAHPDRRAAPATPRSQVNVDRRPVRRRLAVPGGARLRRRPHPRHGLRVPRRRRPLRQAVGPVRRAVRARRLPRPPDRHGNPLEASLSGEPDPRPGRLADVQGLAGARVADPRGHLLQVDGALLARRPAAVRQPAGREQPALPALPVRPDGTRRKNSCDDMDSIRLQAQRHVRAPGLRRRAVGRARQGLVPDRHQPVGGPAGHQRRASSPSSWASRPACPSAAPSRPARPATSPPATPATIDRQLDEVHALGVRQMELVNKFDNALSGVAGDEGQTGVVGQRRQLPRDRLATGTCEHCEPATPGAHDSEQSRRPEISAEQQDALFGAIGAGLRHARHRAPALPAARPLQPAAASPRSASTSSTAWPSARCSSTPTT